LYLFTSLLFDVGVPIRKFDASLNLTLAVARAFAGVEGAKVHTAERPMAAIAARSAVRLNIVASQSPRHAWLGEGHLHIGRMAGAQVHAIFAAFVVLAATLTESISHLAPA
jgi:hypothetical protein